MVFQELRVGLDMRVLPPNRLVSHIGLYILLHGVELREMWGLDYGHKLALEI